MKNLNNERTGVIYFFRNSNNNKLYIGRTLDYKHRLSTHFSRINRGLNNHAFYEDYRQHPEYFTYGILEHDIPELNLNEREKWYVRFFGAFEFGYNQTSGGDTPLHIKFSVERNKKISETLKRVKNIA